MDENIKYELAEAEKLEVIDNAGVAENEKKSIEAYACMCFMATCTCGCVGVAGGSATDVQATRHRLMGTSYMKGA